MINAEAPLSDDKRNNKHGDNNTTVIRTTAVHTVLFLSTVVQYSVVFIYCGTVVPGFNSRYLVSIVPLGTSEGNIDSSRK